MQTETPAAHSIALPLPLPEDAPSPCVPGRPGIAYLLSRYPATSHTFILREVLELRKRGWRIETASINRPDRDSADWSATERSEASSTFYIKERGAAAALSIAVRMLFSRPLALLNTLRFALSLGSASPAGVLRSLFYFAEGLIVGDWMRRENLSHLHVHFGTAVSTVGMIAARAQACECSMTIHGPDEFYDVSAYALRRKIEACRFICCIGSYARSQLMLLSDPSCWNRFRVAPLGVNPSEFLPRPFRRQPACFELLCVGRLTPAKGQMILLRALRQLRGRLPAHIRFRCRFVGEGADRAGLTAFAEREFEPGIVVFEGAVGQARVRECLQEADVFVLPSFAEGIPVALMEAMSMEIPCVSTTVAGIPELIRNGVDGLLVYPSDENELAEALVLLLEDGELRLRLGQAGRMRVRDRYDIDVNVSALSEILQCELVKA